MKQRSPWLVLLLSIVTCGIYPIYFEYTLIKDLDNLPHQKNNLVTAQLYLIVTIIGIVIDFIGMRMALPFLGIISLLIGIFNLYCCYQIGNSFRQYYALKNDRIVPNAFKYIIIRFCAAIIIVILGMVLYFSVFMVAGNLYTLSFGIIGILVLVYIVAMFINGFVYFVMQTDINKLIEQFSDEEYQQYVVNVDDFAYNNVNNYQQVNMNNNQTNVNGYPQNNDNLNNVNIAQPVQNNDNLNNVNIAQPVQNNDIVDQNNTNSEEQNIVHENTNQDQKNI